MCQVQLGSAQADGIRFKVIAGVHWAAAIRHVACVPEDRQLLKQRTWASSGPAGQTSRQHLAPVPLSPVTFYLRSELNNAEVSLLQGGVAEYALMLQNMPSCCRSCPHVAKYALMLQNMPPCCKICPHVAKLAACVARANALQLTFTS